jgi:UrcA family protein
MTCRIIEGEEIMSTLLRRAGGAAFAFSVTFGLVAVLAEQPAMAADVTVTAQIEEDDLPKERVTTADLDLSNPAEVRKLQARIRAASRRVCGYSGVGIARTNPGPLPQRGSGLGRTADRQIERRGPSSRGSR